MQNPLRCRTRRFSLVELMVVLVIVSVLTGLALTSYTRVVRAGAVSTAARDVSSALFYSRQLSVVQRVRVALVMPGRMGGGGDSGIDKGKLYTSYRVAIVSDSGVFLRWDEASKWEYLAGSVTIMEADSDMGIQGSDGSNIAHQRNPEDNGATTIDDVDLSELGGGTTVDGVRAVVFNQRGRLTSNTNLFVTVGQANYGDSGWDVPDVETDVAARNRSAKDQMTLEVSRFSGNVRFIGPEAY